jgi:porphobilinogen synthase
MSSTNTIAHDVSTGREILHPIRTRRTRSQESLRGLVRESHLRVDKLIYPLFLVEGTAVRKPISSMPGIFQQSVDEAVKEVSELLAEGLTSILLFGIPNSKDEQATQSWLADGIVQRAIRELKKRFPPVTVIADTCLCEYMDHGHCGVVRDGDVLNDPSVEILANAALAQAEAGADIVAPSDMMDGRVMAIRQKLDQAGFKQTPIMAYSAKFASALYGPFREAAQSAPQFGDRKSYQMDPANGREALREIEIDVLEGADIVMVKPALSYLDIIAKARDITKVPIAAYNVSGEYSMVKAAAANGWIDERRVVLETLTGIVRAGADMIISYHSRDVARWLSESKS